MVGLEKAMEQLENANLNHCKKLATALHDSVLKRLLPFFNCMDNRLASLLDPRFKQKWIENDDEKKKLYGCYKRTSQVGLVLFKKTVAAATAQMIIMEDLQKSQSYLTSLQKARKRKNRRIQEEK